MKAPKAKALLMTLALSVSISAPTVSGIAVYAASAAAVTGVSGEQADAAAAQTVTVSGLKKGSTVTLYQIVDGYYKDGKLGVSEKSG